MSDQVNIQRWRVSIHAPGRGATSEVSSAEKERILFQFTHPGGVRQDDAIALQELSKGFNSRTREGCDLTWDELAKFSVPFQFTHPGGVRQANGYSKP